MSSPYASHILRDGLGCFNFIRFNPRNVLGLFLCPLSTSLKQEPHRCMIWGAADGLFISYNYVPPVVKALAWYLYEKSIDAKHRSNVLNCALVAAHIIQKHDNSEKGIFTLLSIGAFPQSSC